MTGLLVSVRSAEEARDALTAGAALIDVKEPLHGSLGATDPRVVSEVVRAVRRRVRVSVALGELALWPSDAARGDRFDSAPAADAAARWLRGVAYAKLGLAGSAGDRDWPDRWAAARRAWPASVRPVAVCYADWQRAAAPPPEDVLAAARRLGCEALLVDTHFKDRGGLLDCFDLAALARLAADTRAAGLRLVLAGSLTMPTIRRVLPLAPDYIAVRGAACQGSREGRICPERVRELVALLKAHPPLPAVRSSALH